jgi:hypothetical protein
VHIATAPLKRLQGRGAEEAALLYGLYHLEQHKRGAVQVSDATAAWRLEWSLEKVKRWRRRLLREGVLEEAQKARSKRAAVLILPDALTAADLSRFDETLTREFHVIALAGRTCRL